MNKLKLASALTSFLTIVAALPYELGDAATLIHPSWKAPVALASALATVILRTISAGGNPTPPPPAHEPLEPLSLNIQPPKP